MFPCSHPASLLPRATAAFLPPVVLPTKTPIPTPAVLPRPRPPSLCLPSSPAKIFGRPTLLPRRTVGLYELTRAGVNPYQIFADGSTRNDAVVGGFVLAVVATVIGGAALFPNGVEGPVGGLVGAGLAVWAADALLLESAGTQALSGAVKDAERAALHEAGHFLVGYLCGVRVTGYEMRGEAGVELEFSGKEDVFVCAAVGMGGVAAECLAFGSAEGGGEDLVAVKAIVRDRGGGIGAGEEGVGRVARWGLLQAVLLLKEFAVAHRRLADAMREGKSTTECCAIIEEFCERKDSGEAER